MRYILFSILSFVSLAQPLVVSFNSGEVSPSVKYRVDLEQYSSSCQTLENMVVFPQGAAVRRPGTEYIAATKSSGEARLVPFVYSTTDAYIIELGNQYMRFYRNGGQIQSGGSAYEIVSPYTTAQIDDVQFVQTNDVMTFVHPDVAPYNLSRAGHTDWTMEEIDWIYPPFQEENTEFGKKIKITFLPASLTAWADATDYVFGDMIVTSGGECYTCIVDHNSDSTDVDLDEPAATNDYWYLYYDGAATYGQYIERGATVQISTKQPGIFTADMVGSFFKLTYDKTKTIDTLEYTVNDTYTSDAYRVYGEWRLVTSQTWSGSVTIQKTDDYGNTWTDYRTLERETTSDSNWDISDTETEYDRFYRFVSVKGGGTKLKIEFTTEESDTSGYIEITSLNAGSSIPDGSSQDSYADIVCHYLLNDNAANTTVADASGNGHTAASKRDAGSPGNYNTTNYYDAAVYKVTQDSTPASFHFNPTVEAGVVIPTTVRAALGPLGNELDRSVAFWFRLDTIPGANQYSLFSIEWAAIKLAASVNKSGNLVLTTQNEETTGTTVLAVNTWYHCVVTSEALGTEHKLYLNGDLEINKSYKIYYDYANDLYTIGVEVVAATPTFQDALDGYIDNFSIYKGLLTPLEIMELLGGVEAYGTVRRPVYDDDISTADGVTAWTSRWSEGAWSDENGYPRTVWLYQQRKVFAASEDEPTTLWASKSFKHDNFDTGSGLDNEAIIYDVVIAKQDPILWLYDLDTLLVGTGGGIYRWGTIGTSDPLTPDNPSTLRLSSAGSNSIQPAFIDESILFAERGGHKINELAYYLEADGYSVNDLMLLASHIAQSPIIQMAVQNRPYPILWCVREDGVLLGLSFNKRQRILAWDRHITDGTVESIAVIPGTDEDELWAIVNRTINSATVRYVERMKPFDWGSDDDDCWFVDCGTMYGDDAAETATTTITGLTWLIGESVQVFKGDSYETATVNGSGQITITETIGYPSSTCIIGLPYTSTLKTMPLEVQDEKGFTIGRSKRIKQMFVAFEDSMKFEYSESTTGTYWPVTLEDRTDITTPTTSYRPMLNLTGKNDFEVSVLFKQQYPYPLKLLALYPQVDYSK